MSEQTGYISPGKMTPTYKIWLGMRNRCMNRNNKDFRYYGGRGIKVCERWSEFSAFYADMGPRPEGLTLDRIDNARGYEPGNCRWATRKTQRRNNSQCRAVTVRGAQMLLIDACVRLDMPFATVRMRLHRGWSIDRALSTPVQRVTAQGGVRR